MVKINLIIIRTGAKEADKLIKRIKKKKDNKNISIMFVCHLV